MSRQYIGARYVPVFADPLAWDITKNYDALTMVQYHNDTYTSRKAVPSGTAITNTEYWAKTGNYNAQLQEYIEVASEAGEKADEAMAAITEIDKNTICLYIKPATDQPVAINELQASSPETVIQLPHPLIIDNNTVVKASIFTRGTSMYHPQVTPKNQTNVGTIRLATEASTLSGLIIGQVQASCLYGAEDKLYTNNGEFIITKTGVNWVCSGSTTGWIVTDAGAREKGMLPYASSYAGADSGSMTITHIGLRYNRNNSSYDGAKTCGIYVIVEKRTLANS